MCLHVIAMRHRIIKKISLNGAYILLSLVLIVETQVDHMQCIVVHLARFLRTWRVTMQSIIRGALNFFSFQDSQRYSGSVREGATKESLTTSKIIFFSRQIFMQNFHTTNLVPSKTFKVLSPFQFG